MNSKLAWEKFKSTGMISDYLDYRFYINAEGNTLNCFDFEKEDLSRGISNENKCDWNNNKGNGFK